MGQDRYSRFFELLTRYQRKRRMIGVTQGHGAADSGADLSLSEYSILTVLEVDADKNVEELSVLNKVERSWMSRIVAGLEKRELIKSSVSPHDRRSKLLKITAKGRGVLDQTNAQIRQVMDLSLEALSAAERKEFAKLLSDFADGLGAVDYPLRSDSDPVYMQLGRISRASGSLGDNFMGTGLNVTQCQVLEALYEKHSGEVFMSQIQASLPFDLSTTSRTIADFERQGWVEKKVSAHDKRGFHLVVTTAGKDRVARMHADARETVKSGLREFSAGKIDRLNELFEKITATMPLQSKARLHPKLNIREITTAELETHTGAHTSGGVRSAAEKSFGLFHNNELRAAANVRPAAEPGAVDISFEGKRISRRELLVFLRTCLK